jgi:hypothetical protein
MLLIVLFRLVDLKIKTAKTLVGKWASPTELRASTGIIINLVKDFKHLESWLLNCTKDFKIRLFDQSKPGRAAQSLVLLKTTI